MYQTLQKLILHHPGNAPNTLYYFGNVHEENGTLRLDADECLIFRSYFNMFSARQWKELTSIERVLFQLRLQGEGVLELWKADMNGLAFLVLSIPFCFSEASVQQTKMIPLDELDVACWLCVRSVNSPVTVYDGAVLTDAVPTQKPNLACCFCTYKREREIKRNVQTLLSVIRDSGSPLYRAADIFIADNGHTLYTDDFNNEGNVFLFENANFGGSAGFTRCMIEAAILRKGRYSHLLLMDDDALIHSYVVERTVCLLSFLRPQFQSYMIGGALLSLQQPWIQIENGGEFRNRGTLLNGAQKDLRDFFAVLHNWQEDPKLCVNYNAWFYACIPSDIITEQNLPLPLFLHGDDVEFSLRSRFRIIHMNGICVWHPEPASVRRPHIMYYNHRNYSIIEALCNPEMTATKYCSTEFRKLMRLLTELRYVEAMYTLRGVRDFLDGPAHFLTLNHETLNRELMKWKSFDTCCISDIESRRFTEPLQKSKSRIQKTLDMLLPSQEKQRLYDINTVPFSCVDYSGVKEICFVDRNTGNGVILRRDRVQHNAVLREWWTLARRIIHDYRRAALEWRAYAGELESLPFWKSYLGL